MRLSFNEEEVMRSMNLYKVFARAFKSVSEHSIRDSKEHGFNPTEFAVLESLYTRGPQKLQQIGSRLCLSAGMSPMSSTSLKETGFWSENKIRRTNGLFTPI